jgi:flagellin
MALSIATNSAALQATAAASSVNRDMETSMERLSTGKRINTAADDAAGVAIASRLSSEIRGTNQAIRNSLDGKALIDTAEGAHKEVENILQRMREIAVQGANDTNDADDRINLNAEMAALTIEIDRIASVTTWAGQSLMDSNGSSFSLQVGSATGTKNQITVTIGSTATTTLGVKGAHNYGHLSFGDTGTEVNGATSSNSSVFTPITAAEISTVDTATFNFSITAADAGVTANHSFASDTAYAATTGTAAEAVTVGTEIAAKINASAYMLTFGIAATVSETTGVVTLSAKPYESVDTTAQALNAIKNIEAAIKAVNTQRSELGAKSNRLSHTVSNMTNISTNLSAARGGIEDADFALETTYLAKNQILNNVSTAMLAQSNIHKQHIMGLLQG